MPGLGYAASVSKHGLTRLTENGSDSDAASIAEEIPVALVYNGEPFVVVMASPANLEDLATGFSITEGVVERRDDLQSVQIVRHSRGIELQIVVPPDAAERLQLRRRSISARTGCGVCGIESIDEVLRIPRRVSRGNPVSRDALWRAAGELEQQQPVNLETRAVHAAGFATADGALVVVREDVGRHNALDKVIGALASAGRDPASGFLIVTSRASYELVQKAAVAGAPVLAAISRPTSLAIQLADQANITLIGLLRGRSANVYSHAARIT